MEETRITRASKEEFDLAMEEPYYGHTRGEKGPERASYPIFIERENR